MDDFQRKVHERYGDAPYRVLYEYPVPNQIEGGGGIGKTIELTNTGKLSIWLMTQGGLWYESDVPELESSYAKLTVIPYSVSDTIATINGQKHGVALAPTPSEYDDMITAQRGSAKHVLYLQDPTPPDPSPDVLDDGERNADFS